MPTYVHRTQVLLDDARVKALRQRARETGRPVAELIREGIDHVLGAGGQTAEEAVEAFLSGPEVELGDARATKREILALREP